MFLLSRLGSRAVPTKREPGGATLSIGALSRATAIPVETLRTWERRYGYPIPERKASGHRVYAVSSVPRLRRIAEALANGHRASHVVGASDADLRSILSTAPAPPARERAPVADVSVESELLEAVRLFDPEHVSRRLLAEWARRGPLDFLTGCVAPVVRAVGVAWADGRLEVRHEHFLSERVGDLLRSLRLPYEERATGPLVILTSLPGESHSLGLHMAALVLATNRCRALVLGTECPPPELATLAHDLRARAVGISVSSATGGATTVRRLRALRPLLPRRTTLLVGGDGAPRADAAITTMRPLEELDVWARQSSSGTT
jgi:MerR family transcriptional regulator, light-induced transcriptional regulator